MAILSLVGRQMRHMIGTAGKMFATLAEGKINIEMISQGASEINISCGEYESYETLFLCLCLAQWRLQGRKTDVLNRIFPLTLIVIDNKDSIKALNLIHQSCLTSAAANNILGGEFLCCRLIIILDFRNRTTNS